MDNAQELIKREEKELPTITIKDKADGTFSIFDWTWNDVEINGYDPHPPIKMGEVTV
jgi:thymidylate synthase